MPSKVTASGLTASEAALSRAEPRTAPADFEVESSPAPDPDKGVSVPGFEDFAKPIAELAPTPGAAARKLPGGQTLAARAARRAADVGLPRSTTTSVILRTLTLCRVVALIR
jgi:hypothetical protein